MEPKIRFSSSNILYEEKTLSEISTINPKTIVPLEFEYVDLESVSGTEMTSHRTEHKATAPSRAQRLAKKGDIFYQTVRPYQKNNYYFDMDDDNYVFSTGYAQIRPSIYGKYLFTLLQNDSFLKQVLDNCAGTSFPAINPSVLSRLSVRICTDKQEQQAIASYFTSLDSQISVSTSRLASLKQMKAASLQAMFPQEGETVPKIRFKGFEGEWKKVKADSIFKTFNEKNRSDLPVLSATQDRGMVTRESIGYNIFHDTSNEATYKHILPGQFVIHLRSFQGGFAHSEIEGIASPAYTIMDFKNKDLYHDYYWRYVFMSKEFIKRLELITYGIRDGRSISYDEFKEMSFLVPSKEEQIKIASYLKNLDRQISLQSQRLEKLKQIKSACLDKMFV